MKRKVDRDGQRNMVFYGRVSTEQEAQLSALKNQMQWYDDQLKIHSNWNCIDKYIDEGITGTQAKKRPAFLKMIADAKEGKFDLIATREVSRFARNTAETLIFTRQLRSECGVEVFFIEDNIWTMDGDGELRLSLMATLAQEESRKTSERVRAGQKISRDNGVLYGNGNVLGYDKVGDTFVINEEQAITVRKIFELYNQGLGASKIRDHLEREGLKTSTGKTRWQLSVIIEVIKNPIYKGVIRYGKYYVDDYLDQKQRINYDESTYQYVQGDFTPIISEQEWDKAQKMLQSKTKRTKDGNRMIGAKKSKDIWMRKLECKCGSSIGKIKWRTNKKTGEDIYGYRCNQQKQFGTIKYREKNNLPTEGICDVPMIADWKMDFMAKALLEIIWNERKEDLLAAYDMLLQDEENETYDVSKEVDHLNSQIEIQKKKIENLINMRLDGEISKDELSSMRKKFDDKIKELENKIDFYNDTTGIIDVKKQQEHNLNLLKQILDESIDFSKPKVPEEMIEHFIYKVVALGDNKFRWYINTDDTDELEEIIMVMNGRKNQNPTVTDENGNKFNRLSLTHSSRCCSSTKVGYFLFEFTLSFTMAKAWRKLQSSSNILRCNQYDEINMEVYLI